MTLFKNSRVAACRDRHRMAPHTRWLPLLGCLWGRGMLRPARMATHTGWLALLLLLALTACTATTPADEPDEPVIERNAYITLSANIAAPSLSSRTDEYTFESPEPDNEKIQTMRFIIVRPDGTVEYNIYLDGTTGKLNEDGTIISTTPRVVIPNEKKTIYLIGNEASLSQTIRDKIRLLTRGDAFDKSLITETITMDGSGPLFDANDPIPMTEIYQIEIKEAPTTDDGKGSITNPYTYNLFVTRAAVKFGFYISNKSLATTDIRITDVTFHELADKEYLFPTETTYDPVKSVTEGTTSQVNRKITAYSCPSSVTPSEYNFKMPENFGINYIDDSKVTFPFGTYEDNPSKGFTPTLYFAETPVPQSGKYTVDITATFGTDNEGNTISNTFKNIELTNLPNLPRNTFVKIIMTPGGTTLDLEVIVQPYTGVWLNPNFGIDRD